MSYAMDDTARASMAKLWGEPGTPVPQVDIADLKAVWKKGREVQRGHEGQHVGIGIRVLEQVCSVGAEVKAVAYRANMLALLVRSAQPQLADSINNDEPSEALFKAFAQVRMEWLAVGVEYHGLPIDEEDFARLLKAS